MRPGINDQRKQHIAEGHEGIDYAHWRLDRAFALVPAQAFVGNWLQSFKEFPPRQKPGSFSLSRVKDKLAEAPSN